MQRLKVRNAVLEETVALQQAALDAAVAMVTRWRRMLAAADGLACDVVSALVGIDHLGMPYAG